MTCAPDLRTFSTASILQLQLSDKLILLHKNGANISSSKMASSSSTETVQSRPNMQQSVLHASGNLSHFTQAGLCSLFERYGTVEKFTCYSEFAFVKMSTAEEATCVLSECPIDVQKQFFLKVKRSRARYQTQVVRQSSSAETLAPSIYCDASTMTANTSAHGSQLSDISYIPTHCDTGNPAGSSKVFVEHLTGKTARSQWARMTSAPVSRVAQMPTTSAPTAVFQ